MARNEDDNGGAMAEARLRLRASFSTRLEGGQASVKKVARFLGVLAGDDLADFGDLPGLPVGRAAPLFCAARDDGRYSGYDEGGQYCEAASPALDDDAHLLLHSGRLGVVVDVGPHARNLLPRLGATSGTAATARAVYDALNTSSTNITLDVACGPVNTSYVLGTTGGGPTLTPSLGPALPLPLALALALALVIPLALALVPTP